MQGHDERIMKVVRDCGMERVTPKAELLWQKSLKPFYAKFTFQLQVPKADDGFFKEKSIMAKRREWAGTK
jgi:hypothetical protein